MSLPAVVHKEGGLPGWRVMIVKDITHTNSFSLGSQIGGPGTPQLVLQQEQRLRNAFSRWVGSYTGAIRQFAFILRVDGSIHRYTELSKIRGAQKAERKKD
jgi:hypothetical protein